MKLHTTELLSLYNSIIAFKWQENPKQLHSLHTALKAVPYVLVTIVGHFDLGTEVNIIGLKVEEVIDTGSLADAGVLVVKEHLGCATMPDDSDGVPLAIVDKDRDPD